MRNETVVRAGNTPDIATELSETHGLRAMSAASLLVIGRRALHAYSRQTGLDLSALVELQRHAVAALAHGWKLPETAVDAAIASVEAIALSRDFSPTPPEPIEPCPQAADRPLTFCPSGFAQP